MTKVAAMPINLLLQNQRANDLGAWYAAFGDMGLRKFVQMMILG